MEKKILSHFTFKWFFKGNPYTLFPFLFMVFVFVFVRLVNLRVIFLQSKIHFK